MITRVTADVLDDPAVREDLMRLGKQFYKELHGEGQPNMELWLRTWAALLLEGHGMMFIATSGPMVIGVIGAILAPDPFTGKTMVVEQCWFVDPNHRGSAGIRLLNEVLDAAKQLNIQKVLMAHMHVGVSEKAEALYERLGFKKLETYYLLS